MKLNFVYSTIYDNLLSDMSKKEFTVEQMKEMEFYCLELEASWEKEGKRIIREIEKVSNLKFKENKICFLVKNMKYAAISNPLTLKKQEHLERAKTILIHELTHVLLEDNREKILKTIQKTYPGESFEFKLHIPVLLITRKVIEKIYDPNILKDVLEDEMKRDVLNTAWPEANRLYPKFKGGIIKFIKNEKLH